MSLLFNVATLVGSLGLIQAFGQKPAPVVAAAPPVINACTSQKLDGQTVPRLPISECQRRNLEARDDILKRAHNSAKEAFNKEIVKGPSPSGTPCIEKAVQGPDRCMLDNIINDAVKSRRYNIAEKGNLTVLSEDKTPVVVRVTVNYKITTIEMEPEKKKSIVDLPNKRTMYFNKIGQLIGAEGDFTTEADDDPCKPCTPNKTIETNTERCNLGCHLNGTSGLITRVIQKKNMKQPKKGGKDSSDDKNGGTGQNDADSDADKPHPSSASLLEF